MNVLNNKEMSKAYNPQAEMFAALARARGEFPEIPRNRIATIRMKAGGQYSYRYADLSDVIGATTPALAAYGITIMQWPEGLVLKTMIAHEGGASLVQDWPIKAMPQRSLDDAQQFQSAVQVAKRYAMTALLGISTEETVEGDAKAHKTVHQGGQSSQPENPFIEGDGIRAPKGAIVKSGMPKAEMAKESARAIIAQFDEPKTTKGLEGVWSRNERFIEVFKNDYDALFQDVYDAFCEAQRAIEEAA